MSIILTEKQEAGLKLAIQRYKEHKKYTVISGYAGTGKTTLVKFIVNNLPGVDPEVDVVYASFTGKAAQQLLKKGNKNVITLHKLLFESIPKPDGTFYRKIKPSIDYSVVVVDEISMAPKELIDILLKHRVYCIFLGDPFQLPPIDKDQDNHLLDKPHIFLDQIMRQALDSEIIRLSLDIRNGKSILSFKGSDAIVMNEKDFNTGVMLWGDQILCATNKTRIDLNIQMRNLLGHEGEPEEGDKVICLRNYWDYSADNADPLVNGTIGYLNRPYSSFVFLPRYYGGHKIDIISSEFISDSGATFDRLKLDKKMILQGERCLDSRTIYLLNKNPRTMGMVPLEFTYGYAITCHKAQGSEWDKVVVKEENFPFDREEHARWLYTAVTRASEKLVLVLK